MRIIKFRAWDKSEKRMMFKNFFDRNWYATPKNDEKGCHCLRALMPSDSGSVELMQYTGLRDKNGKEIYEGDIVRHVLLISKPPKLVSWNDAFGYWYPFITNLEVVGRGYEWSVIGNIHENPELLK